MVWCTFRAGTSWVKCQRLMLNKRGVQWRKKGTVVNWGKQKNKGNDGRKLERYISAKMSEWVFASPMQVEKEIGWPPVLRDRQAAKERQDLYMLQVREGKRKERKHSGNLEKLAGLDNLELESALARKYNIWNKRGAGAKNGGQIVKDWLVSQGTDVNQFNTEDKQREKQPRRKLCGVGGEIAVPSAETNDAMWRMPSEPRLRMVSTQLVSWLFQRSMKNWCLTKKEFCTVEGRKRPLDEIHQTTMLKHKEYTWQHPDEHYEEMSRLEVSRRLGHLNEFGDTEGLTVMCQKLNKIQRHADLLVWHNHSTVASWPFGIHGIVHLWPYTVPHTRGISSEDWEVGRHIQSPETWNRNRRQVQKQRRWVYCS